MVTTARPDETRAAPEPAWLFAGIPAGGRALAHPAGLTRPPQLVLPGTASFLLQLKTLPWSLRVLHFGTPDALRPGMRLARLPCINFMADADLYAGALAQAEALTRQMGTPCFNPPHAVAATTRDGVARLLAGVAGLQVPVTVRVRATRVAELRRAMDDAGLRFPVIARMAGDQGGVSTVKLDGDADWELLHALPWGGRDLYLTQYVDFSDDAGWFRKLRLAVVGEDIFIKHHYTSRQWMIHFRARDAVSDAEEPQFLREFDSVTLPRIRPAVHEMARRMGLDYFGIDACLRPDGRLLLFEANATMDMLDNHAHKGPLWTEPTRRIADALAALLARPERWRSSQSQAVPRDAGNTTAPARQDVTEMAPAVGRAPEPGAA
jgi:glutathione synthase/RimK-type ligase-like ATP-grasp enzyme